jgi:hypothetical protein
LNVLGPTELNLIVLLVRIAGVEEETSVFPAGREVPFGDMGYEGFAWRIEGLLGGGGGRWRLLVEK